MKDQFLILSAYTGVESLSEALRDKQSKSLLWLEILFNDSVHWESKLGVAAIRSSYRKASVWYRHFRTLINQTKKRKPLKECSGDWDRREYRRFIEALNYVESQTRADSKTAR